MTAKKLLLVAALCLALFIAIGLTVDLASAQELGTKTFDKQQLPNKWEMAAGFGSIFVMIAVLKWL